MSSTLMAHKDTRRISEKAVCAIPEPEWTDTWHPVSHSRVINCLENAVVDAGLKIVDRQYSMNKLGTKMFGAWDVKNGGNADERIWSLGLRNGVAKNLSVGICAGERVFVCDNLAFSGDIISFRKHTKTFDVNELDSIAREAVASLKDHFKQFDNWLEKIGAVPLDAETIKKYLYSLTVEEGIMPSSKLPELHDYILGETPAPECTHDFRGFHGAITRGLRGDSLFNIQDRSSKLVTFINNRI